MFCFYVICKYNTKKRHRKTFGEIFSKSNSIRFTRLENTYKAVINKLTNEIGLTSKDILDLLDNYEVVVVDDPIILDHFVDFDR